MTDLQRVIDEAKPMLEEFLVQIGLHRPGHPLDLARLLTPFSVWVDAQEIGDDDRYYLASRLGAFICEYLIVVCDGQRVIEGERILMQLPFGEGIRRQFDPYAVAVGMVTERSSLKAFLDSVVS
jgi:hypothetical protein